MPRIRSIEKVYDLNIIIYENLEKLISMFSLLIRLIQIISIADRSFENSCCLDIEDLGVAAENSCDNAHCG
jgi:hypothetical protein